MHSNEFRSSKRRGGDLVAVTAIDGAAGTAVVWRTRGNLFVTTIVKGTFHLSPDSAMVPILAEPISLDEKDDGSGMGLYSACELAPYLRYTDVALTGHAHPPAGVTEFEARLHVVRDGLSLLDKSMMLRVPEELRASPHPLVRIVGMASLSESWPVRRALLGDLDPLALEGAIVEIPDGFDWSYFQAAPSDQRIGALRGDEWVACKGMHGDRTWFWTRLPGVRAGARAYGALGAPPEGLPIRLWADSLHLDVDQQSCSMLWRGWFPVSEERELEAIQVVMGLDLPGKVSAWIAPLEVEAEGGIRTARGQVGAPPARGWPSWMPPRRSSVPPSPPASPFDANGPEAYANTVLSTIAEPAEQQGASRVPATSPAAGR